mmetsp:Transcript_28330/g.71141  ORF Transcript_28330/g.71141 Transcript_28330/m.71141 type:complete len:93 (-) Transcript_28330:454-732(-)
MVPCCWGCTAFDVCEPSVAELACVNTQVITSQPGIVNPGLRSLVAHPPIMAVRHSIIAVLENVIPRVLSFAGGKQGLWQRLFRIRGEAWEGF